MRGDPKGPASARLDRICPVRSALNLSSTGWPAICSHLALDEADEHGRAQAGRVIGGSLSGQDSRIQKFLVNERRFSTGM
jgi:hypothetical protein